MTDGKFGCFLDGIRKPYAYLQTPFNARPPFRRTAAGWPTLPMSPSDSRSMFSASQVLAKR